jgi:hypothetical protein
MWEVIFETVIWDFAIDSLEGISLGVAGCLELKRVLSWGVFPLTKVCA